MNRRRAPDRRGRPHSLLGVTAVAMLAAGCGGAPLSGNTGGVGGGGGSGTGGTAGTGGAPGAGGRAATGGGGTSGPGGAAVSAPSGSLTDTRPVVSASVAGYQLMVTRRNPDGTTAAPAAFDMRGVSWSPATRGQGAPVAATYASWVPVDGPLMKQAHINTIKAYGPIDRTVLDVLLQNGIVAIVTVLVRSTDNYAAVVTGLRDHPAVLMWMVGNEWNRNHLYSTCTGDACYTRINEVAADIKRLDPHHPVATSFAPDGELPSQSDLMRLSAVEVWGLNVYSQPGFFGRFTAWLDLNARLGISKPFFMSEYGADGYNSLTGAADEPGQAAALMRQTEEIRGQLSARQPGLPCLGGTPFEWNDEWWKTGASATQDTTGFANGGVAPDQVANEDWWGIVDIERRPRQSYAAIQALYAR